MRYIKTYSTQEECNEYEGGASLENMVWDLGDVQTDYSYDQDPSERYASHKQRVFNLHFSETEMSFTMEDSSYKGEWIVDGSRDIATSYTLGSSSVTIGNNEILILSMNDGAAQVFNGVYAGSGETTDSGLIFKYDIYHIVGDPEEEDLYFRRSETDTEKNFTYVEYDNAGDLDVLNDGSFEPSQFYLFILGTASISDVECVSSKDYNGKARFVYVREDHKSLYNCPSQPVEPTYTLTLSVTNGGSANFVMEKYEESLLDPPILVVSGSIRSAKISDPGEGPGSSGSEPTTYYTARTSCQQLYNLFAPAVEAFGKQFDTLWWGLDEIVVEGGDPAYSNFIYFNLMTPQDFSELAPCLAINAFDNLYCYVMVNTPGSDSYTPRLLFEFYPDGSNEVTEDAKSAPVINPDTTDGTLILYDPDFVNTHINFMIYRNK